MEVVWRGLQLDPMGACSFDDVLVARVMRHHRMSLAAAKDLVIDVHRRLRAVAARESLLYNPELAGPVDTLAAHRMVHLAGTHGLSSAAVKRIQEAYFAGGTQIDDPDTLVTLLADVGIDAVEAGPVARGDAFIDSVLEDRERAAELGVTSVPFFVLDGRYALSGVPSESWLLAALSHCWGGERVHD